MAARLISFLGRSFLLVASGGAGLRGQEMTVSGGILAPSSVGDSSYTWQIEYRQDVLRHFSASAAWLNEGHLADHHRDGTAWQGWLNFPFWRDRVALSVGAGAYFYFDTRPRPGGDTADVHGVAPIYSGSATFYVSDRGFIRVGASRISATESTKVTTGTIGVGYWLGADSRPVRLRRSVTPAPARAVTDQEFTAFAGESVVNTFFSENALAAAVEYRRGLARHLDWTATYLNEGDPQIIRRNGFATQIWPVAAFLNETITLGFGVGPYFYFERKAATARPRQRPGIAPLLSPTLSLRLNKSWLVRLVWDRVMTDYDRDADVFLLGVGRRWR